MLGGVNAAGELIANSVRKDANIFFGMSIDESLGEEVKLTLIATGLEQDISRHKPSSVTQQQQQEGGHRRIKPPSIGGLWGRGRK
jgi:cell division protein FtsZ